MDLGARSPEELEVLLEDVLLLGDRSALGALFGQWAVLSVGCGPEVRGVRQIGDRLAALGTYLADPQLVIQCGDLALVLSRMGASVTRRSPEGAWRYEIVHLQKWRPGKEWR